MFLNPDVLQLHAWQWCNGEQHGYDTKILFRLVAHYKYHALSVTPRLSKKGIILDLHISHAWHMWVMSVWNGWRIGFVTLPTLLTEHYIWKRGTLYLPCWGAVQSSSTIGVRHWFPKLQKRIIHIISPKTKAILKQHINTTTARVVQRPTSRHFHHPP
jgi:hypothetical protein